MAAPGQSLIQQGANYSFDNLTPEGNANIAQGIGNWLTGNVDWQRQLAMFNASNAFNAEQAQIQRDWESHMSNTAYQRAVADMAAAGLNPYLAYQQGGAATPSGASAHASTPSAIQSGKGASSILGAVIAAVFGIAGKAISASTAASNAALSSQTTLQAAAMRDAVLTQNASLAASTSASNARLAADTSIANAKLMAQNSLDRTAMQGSNMAKVANIQRESALDVAKLYKMGVLPSGRSVFGNVASHFDIDPETARILKAITVKK